MVAVRELVFLGEADPKLYACGQCGSVHSPKIYACRDDLAHETARRAAADCCVPRYCSDCGGEVDKYRTKCGRCRESERLRKCEVIKAEDWTDPVQSDAIYGEWGEGYSSCVSAMLELAEGLEEEATAYCWPCTPKAFKIDPERVLEGHLEDHHEDAADSVVAADEFYAFIEAWNGKQNLVSWYPDHSRVVVLDPERFELLRDQMPLNFAKRPADA